MKRIIIALALCLTFGLTVAVAGDGGALYNKKCAKCHGVDGAKTSGASGGTLLQGQTAGVIKGKLMGYKNGTYGGKKKKTMMRLMKKFNDQQVAELAAYIGGL